MAGKFVFEPFGGLWRRRRFELLDNLECLKSRRLRLDDVVVAGVAHGRPVAQALSARVLAARSAAGGARDGRQKFVTSLRPADWEDDQYWTGILREIFAGDGWLLLEDHVGLTLCAGELRGIEIHRPLLRHFCYIRSYVDLLHLFGLPEGVSTSQGEDGSTEHTLYYRRQYKQLVWNCRENALVLVRLGDIDERPRIPRPPRGGQRHALRPRPPFGSDRPPIAPPAWGWAPQAG